jgi:hypothetical protein
MKVTRATIELELEFTGQYTEQQVHAHLRGMLGKSVLSVGTIAIWQGERPDPPVEYITVERGVVKHRVHDYGPGDLVSAKCGLIWQQRNVTIATESELPLCGKCERAKR